MTDRTETVTIIDGGMGRELKRIGAPFKQPEWSALTLMEAPEYVKTAHRNFIDAGAEVITVNAYAIVPYHLGNQVFVERGTELVSLAARLARETANESSRDIKVAGCLPPLFGSYQPELFNPEHAPDIYASMIDTQAPHVDMWLAETMGSIEEAQAVGKAVAAGDQRSVARRELWTSFHVTDEVVDGKAILASGESVTDAVLAAAEFSDAVLINCAAPESVDAAMTELAKALSVFPDKRFGGYANTFEPKRHDGYAPNNSILNDRDELTPVAYAGFAESWVNKGATIIGGCCGIYPEHICELAERFRL